MTKKTTEKDAPKDDPEQSKRFVETAKELEADESKENFEKALKGIVRDKRSD